MSKKLKVAYYQQDIIWEDTEANLKKTDSVLHTLEKGTELLILPEMFHAGFTMDPGNVAEKMDGRVVTWMQSRASENNMTIIGSVIIEENEKFLNRLFVVHPGGNYEHYDKRHLFSIGGEGEKYKRGEKRLTVEVNNINILPMICYDLRFPVWSRWRNDYEILIYIANWPASRREVWKTLLKARAIENQCFVIGVNRVGEDSDSAYSGDSMVIDAKGEVISSAEENNKELITCELDIDSLISFRERFPVWKDADDFEIN